MTFDEFESHLEKAYPDASLHFVATSANIRSRRRSSPMARGGARLNAGRRSSWTSGCGVDDTTTIRIGLR